MAAELSSMRMRNQGGIMIHLSSAACEWILIILLYVDAAFSYLLREFAKYCELQTPCPLCSRLDHVFGREKLGCNWSLVCSSHKEKISSLVFCSVHSKLADVCGLCEECFKPIAMQNDSEYLKLNLMLDKHITLGSSGSRSCSCCNKPWIAVKSDDESLLELKSIRLGDYKANVEPPLTHEPGHRRSSRQDSVKKLREKLRESVRHRTSGKNSVRTLSRVGYPEFKLSSDSESEFPLPEIDGGDGNSSSVGAKHTRLEHDVEVGRRDRLGKPANNVSSEKKTHQSSEMKDQPGLLYLDDLKIEHSPREYRLAKSKRSLRWMKDVVSSDCVPQPSDVGSLGASAESFNISLPNYSTLSEVSDSIHTVPSASSTVRITKKSIYIEETCERVNRSATMNIEATAGTSSDDNSTCSSYSYSINQTGSLWRCAENMKSTEEDAKSISQASKSEVGLLLKDACPGPHYGHEESRKDEDCSSHSLPLPVSLKKNDSSYEFLDGLSVGDVEGESIIDQLRRQVEHDQSCMKSLYEELEEERNAADIAANQAMAMITRLQEEKAAVEMEALQYIRMMELQAEYDMVSLEIANDLLSEKEKELHTELEFYRNNFCDGSGLEDLQEETSVLDDHAAACENTPVTSCGSELAKFYEGNRKCEPMSSSVSTFGDEKLYVSHSLTKLAKNLYKNYCSENVEDTRDGLDSCKMKDDVGPIEYFLTNVDTMLNFEQNGSSASKGNLAHYYESNDSSADAKEDYFHDEKNDLLHSLAAFVKENATLHDRLGALETDQDLLKYCSNLLQNGEDGLQLTLDIAHQLQKMQK
ncbi:hypothetical protein C2S53_016641 [Perilla frutescens var. hirtella]|uniref:GTD-binding domain-containing protein n=1 Tax=Perilla frutescens var. hirtella TaxID=608512 RepID=A0AAD4IY73_PERFH|nr:hypothetical protein C2S53_016641 [Perilla frutescens var. hirtella]